MNNEVDLQSYEIHTDLVMESISKTQEKIDSEIIEKGKVKVTRVYVPKELEDMIDKKHGNYVTIEFQDITDHSNYEEVLEITKEELKKLLQSFSLKEKDLIMVLGLGNIKSTPDALGPMAIDQVLVTNHLFLLGELSEGFRPVSAFAPGVMAQTGIETSDFIFSLKEKLQPKLILVIDALASSSMERVNKTIQLTDTGIHPGSGVGNHRKEISQDILNVPVIAIGVPTVVSAATIVSDTIEYMTKYFSYSKKNINNPSSKLKPASMINYWNEPQMDSKEDDIELFGKIGLLNEEEKRAFIYEILAPTGYNFMVTPKEVDFVIQKLSLLLAEVLNQCFHTAYQK